MSITFLDDVFLDSPARPTPFSADAALPPPVRVGTLDLVEMLLKDPQQLNRLLRMERFQRELIPRLLAIAVFAFTAFGILTTGILNAVQYQSGVWLAHVPASHWNDSTLANLTLSYTLGLIAANGICLPSFYFYMLLAGVRVSMLEVTAHALKGMAAGGMALVGLLPVYAAVALTSLVFPLGTVAAEWIAVLGLALPFLAGLWGVANLYAGFIGLCDTMSCERRRNRECFVRRLMLAWCGCFTMVTPAVIYSLWDYFSRGLL